MRIVFVSPCPFGEFGGVQLSGQIAWSGIASSAPGEARLVCYGNRQACRQDSGDKRILCSASRLGFCWNAIKVNGADVIFVWHIHMLRLLPLLRGRGSKVILFLHGIECWRPLDPYTKYLLQKVDLFVSNSDFTWRRFLDYHPRWRESAHYSVPLGVGESTSQRPTPGSPPAALIVGRMLRTEDYKGHRELVRAWPLVLERAPTAELWICGGGDLRWDLEALAESLSVKSKIRFFGEVTDQEKQDLLQKSRCLAMPSRGEGFGLVYLEAMRWGRPCLVSVDDAGQEVVNPPEAGLSVDTGDIAQLANSLCRLLAPGAEWDSWSAGARRRYQHFYTAELFQKRLVDILTNCTTALPLMA
jgi:phosphatidylinositol alpha-1,6-mannosyltransferase